MYRNLKGELLDVIRNTRMYSVIRENPDCTAFHPGYVLVF